MRKFFGPRLLLCATGIAAVGVWVACGGSDSQDVQAVDAGRDVVVLDTSAALDTGILPDTSVAPVPEAGPIYDAGAPNVLEGGPGFEGGIPCVVGGLVEEEPNDDPSMANPLTPTRCGAVLVEDGGLDGGENDYLTFTLGDASTSFFLQYSGQVKVNVEVDGSAPVDITAPDASLKLVKDQPYFVQVRSATGKTEVWRVTLFTKP